MRRNEEKKDINIGGNKHYKVIKNHIYEVKLLFYCCDMNLKTEIICTETQIRVLIVLSEKNQIK